MKSYLIAFALFGILVATIWGYVNEIIWFQRTLDVGTMVKYAALAGAAIGLVKAIVFKIILKVTDQIAVIRLFASFILLGAAMLPLVASLVNRHFAQAPEKQPVTFISEKAYYKSVGVMQGQQMPANGYYFRFFKDGNTTDTLRVEFKEPRYVGAEPGSQVALSIRKGMLGFDVAE